MSRKRVSTARDNVNFLFLILLFYVAQGQQERLQIFTCFRAKYIFCLANIITFQLIISEQFARFTGSNKWWFRLFFFTVDLVRLLMYRTNFVSSLKTFCHLDNILKTLYTLFFFIFLFFIIFIQTASSLYKYNGTSTK